jgi:hypothetical protein
VAVIFTTKKSVLVFLCAGISVRCNQLETAFEKLKLPSGVEHIISYLWKESWKYVMGGGLCLELWKNMVFMSLLICSIRFSMKLRRVGAWRRGRMASHCVWQSSRGGKIDKKKLIL